MVIKVHRVTSNAADVTSLLPAMLFILQYLSTGNTVTSVLPIG
jgi:hypothetical protein